MNKKTMAGRWLSYIPFSFIKTQLGTSYIIPYYHLVSDEDVVHVKHLYPYKNVNQFRKDIDFLLRQFEPIELKDLIAHIRHEEPLRKRCFLLTFDDGYREMYSIVAPILYRIGVPAVFFLNSDFIDNKDISYKNKASLLIEWILKKPEEAKNNLFNKFAFDEPSINSIVHQLLNISYQERHRFDSLSEAINMDFNAYLNSESPYLTSSEICDMIKMGFDFGAHSLDHPHYSELTLAEQVYQALKSLKFLKQRFDLKHSVFSFPHNDNFVSMEFFNQISNDIDLTFGTNGLLSDTCNFNLQRMNFEKTLRPARDILAWHIFRRAAYRFQKKEKILRK